MKNRLLDVVATKPNNTALTHLSCGDNRLTNIDVSNNTALESLYCNDNELTNLNVNNNTALKRLYCNNNQITSLVVNKNTTLTGLHCQLNQMSANALDALFNTLPTSSFYSTIYIYGNPGTATCTPSIATEKGWTVNTNPW
jgi:Leucine-rich repeat (LRR) protein